MRGSSLRVFLLAIVVAGCSSPAPISPQHVLFRPGQTPASPASAPTPATPHPNTYSRPGPISRVSDSIVQIGILRQANRVNLRAIGTVMAVDQKNGDTYELEPSTDYLLTAGSGRTLQLGPHRFQGQFRLAPTTSNGYVQLGPKKYRGSLLVRSNGGSLTVVNEVGIEEYIEGVLPAEMSNQWPYEALKAQAVVARSFALANLDKFRAQGFDLSDDNRSQAYGDIDKFTPQTSRAVRETQGQVLTWNGKILSTFFHSCCGGHTGSVGTIWGSLTAAPKPLRGVSDRFCVLSPEYNWDAYFATDDIAAALQKHGVPVTKIQGVRVGQYDYSSGYMKTIRVKANRKWIEIRANDFRNWIGNRDFKSTKVIRIVSQRHGYHFFGRGYGHGVGLCQWGAKIMAEKGKSYQSILKFYFPGAKLETRED